MFYNFLFSNKQQNHQKALKAEYFQENYFPKFGLCLQIMILYISQVSPEGEEVIEYIQNIYDEELAYMIMEAEKFPYVPSAS